MFRGWMGSARTKPAERHRSKSRDLAYRRLIAVNSRAEVCAPEAAHHQLQLTGNCRESCRDASMALSACTSSGRFCAGRDKRYMEEVFEVDSHEVLASRGEYQVHIADQSGGRILASGTDIASDSLALAGSTVYWTQNGQPYAAPLN